MGSEGSRHEILTRKDHEALLAKKVSTVTLEDSDSETTDAPAPDSKAPTNDEKPSGFSAEPMDEHEKLSFAAGCLFMDIRRIVAHVSTRWDLYAQGKADLVPVTTTSQPATMLIQRLEEDFMAEFRQIEGLYHLLAGFFPRENPGRAWAALINADSEDPEDVDMVQRADYCFYPIWVLSIGEIPCPLR